MATTYESNGLKYVKNGDYLIPQLGLTELGQKPIAKYGRMRRAYLEKNNPALYSYLIHSGKLYEQLAEIDEACRQRMEQMIPQMAMAEGVTEQMKADNQMAWVQRMNSIHASAEEIIMKELVYD